MKTVYFIPKASNPYQDILATQLKRYGVEVKYLNCLPSIAWIRENRNKGIYFHVHWPSRLYRNGRKTFIKLFIFLIKLLYLNYSNIPVFWTCHNILPHDRSYLFWDYIAHFLLAHFVSHIFVHGNFAKKKVRSYYFCSNKRITIIKHGNYINSYENSIKREDARTFFNISKNDFVFLFLGRILPYKGVDDLIIAFKKLNTKNNKLIIAGWCDKNYKNTLEQLIDNDSKIIFNPEKVDDIEIQFYFNASNIMVTPFKKILTSGSVILGLSFGIPVVVPKIGVIPEVLDDSCSFLYKKKSQLFETLERCISTNNLSEMRKNALKKAKQLDWESIAEMTAEIYKKNSNY